MTKLRFENISFGPLTVPLIMESTSSTRRELASGVIFWEAEVCQLDISFPRFYGEAKEKWGNPLHVHDDARRKKAILA